MKKFLKFIGVVLLSGFFVVTLTGCTPEQAQNSSQNIETKAPVVEFKTETKNEAIPFTTANENDSALAAGQTKVKQEGKDGNKEFTYKVTYTDGNESFRELASEKITVEPINKIILIGTKVSTSNSAPATQNNSGSGYTNVDGNYVQSPGSDPSGATAKCRDGTYSYSQHRSGTCSYHGGVAEWL